MSRRLAALAATTLLLALAGSTSATASTYCGYDPGGYGTCAGPYQALSKNAAIAQTASWATCAGARTSGGSFYGQYFCASDYSCHTYGGGNLTGLAHNHEGFGQTIYGATNGNADPLSCPRGGPLSKRVGRVSVFRRGLAAARLGARDPVVRTFAHRDQRCLTVTDGTVGHGVTCADAAEVREHGLVGVLREAADGAVPGDGVVFALPPEDATRATIRQADGSATTASVSDGLVTAAVSDARATIAWDGDAGRRALP